MNYTPLTSEDLDRLFQPSIELQLIRLEISNIAKSFNKSYSPTIIDIFIELLKDIFIYLENIGR